jgi:hypothetical protein
MKRIYLDNAATTPMEPEGNCKTFCHARMLLSGIHDFKQLKAGFPPRSVAGMTELGVLQLAHIKLNK